ncbi:hypothetical protein HNQ02_002270 [Flavobacterium sp. 7E]|uniref:YceI family protein n=1 Tax=Flavobacterium sp. 7E TaxID=2735898 RepID=UPI001570DC37|nr:YceI family protein [Flavobacterium sp. 7E]NRS89344.1 hypothetical protein [Flavobacterium sp. 7E]
MNRTLLLFLLFFSNTILAQDKITTSKGTIVFEASVAFFEAVTAKNDQVHCVLNASKGHISFIAYIREFRFERSLMEQHFNENYLESDRYPKATFKGIIEKFDLKNITTTSKTHYIKGKIYIHGKSKGIRVLANIIKTKTGIKITTNFSLNTDDFKIEIPFMVRNKIAKEVNVSVDMDLK